MVLLYLLSTAALGCEIEYEVDGLAFDERKSPTTFRLSTRSSGTLVHSDMTMYPAPTAFRFQLRGKKDFKFSFSSNITKVRLKIGSALLYEGVPMASLNATSNPARGLLTIEPEWTGMKFSVKVVDDCSFGSVLRSFFE